MIAGKEAIEEEVVEEEEEEEEDDGYRSCFHEILFQPTSLGNFVFGDHFEHGGCGPQISVSGVGRIGLPLSQEQAITLISMMEQAPYGKGSETVTDISVRDVLQLDASRVSLDKQWEKDTLSSLVSNACNCLGLDSKSLQIEAHLYKLLLYKEGGHFKKHRDTEKEKGMFGSLIVQLESEHEGGELIVEHNGIVKKYCFATNSADKPAFVAFFSDCEHTLHAVTSGLRLVLAFNLVMTNATPSTTVPQEELPSAVKTYELLSKYIEALKSWEEDIDGPEKLVWKLEHQYTETNLCFSQLKGNDRAAVHALRSIRDSESGMELLDMYLVLMEKHEMGEPEDSPTYGYQRNYNSGNDDDDDNSDDENNDDSGSDGSHNMGEVLETEESILQWVGLEGVVEFKGLSIDIETECLNSNEDEDIFGDDPVREEYQGYTGNDGPSLDYWYHAALLVFWPKKHSFSIALQHDLSVAMGIVKEKFACHQDDADDSLAMVLSHVERQLESFLQKAIKATIGIDKSFALLLSLCSLSSAHRRNSLIKSALKLLAVPVKVPTTAWSSSVRALGPVGPLTAMQVMKLLELNDIDIGALQPEISAALRALDDSNILYAANMALSLQSNSAISPAVRVMVASQVTSALSTLSLKMVPSAGLIALLRVLCTCDDYCEQSNLDTFLQPARWQQVPLPALADLIAFIASTSAAAAAAAEEDNNPLSTARDSLQEFILQMIQTVILRQASIDAKSILAIFKSTMLLSSPAVWQQPIIMQAFVDKVVTL